MDKIICVDSFLHDAEYKIVAEKVKNLRWIYGHVSSGIVTENQVPFWSASLDDDTYFTEYLFNIIKKTVNQPLVLDRVYCNGLTYGQSGSFHTDSDNENSRTFIIYVHDINPEDYDAAEGYLCFKIPELGYNILYEPIKNRGIYFPGNLKHKAVAFSRFIKTMRVSISWKMHV